MTLTILLVDDDSVDLMAIKRSFVDLKIGNPVVEARDGIEALKYLRGEDGYRKIPQPCLVLLDLNMPNMNGIEFLTELRHDPDLHGTVVFVLTTSAAEVDRRHAVEQDVAGYVLKHRPGQTFIDSIRLLTQYWKLIEFPEVSH